VAKQLLETTFMSVKEVMFAVGINDLSHFVRDFSKRYGKTPAKYRADFLRATQTEEVGAATSANK
jgi:transcriptional regulator GlxA family with amidase domain